MTAPTMREIFVELIDNWRMEGYSEPADELEEVYEEFYGERKESKGAPPPSADASTPGGSDSLSQAGVQETETAVHEDPVDVPEDNA